MDRLKRLGIHLPLLFVLIVVSVTLRTVALYKNYIFGTGYFSNETVITVANIIVLIGSLFLLSFIFISPNFKAVSRFNGPETYISSGIVATALIFLSADLVLSVATKPGRFISRATLTSADNLLVFAVAATALLSVGYFILTVLYTRRQHEKRAIFGIITAAFLALYAAYLFYDSKLPINSPSKLVDQTALLLTALFFLFETRISLGREKQRAYCAFGMVASLNTAYSSIPTLIHYFAAGKTVSDSLAGAILMLALFIYVSSRVILVDFLKNDEKSKTAAIVESLMKKRLEEIELPEESRVRKEEEFNTLGKNYEFNLHISSDIQEVAAEEENTNLDG